MSGFKQISMWYIYKWLYINSVNIHIIFIH
jgi:hypothetical protein